MRRYSIPYTHLFPGAKLTDLDGAPEPMRQRERALIEFSDGVCVSGMIEAVAEGGYRLSVPTYRTQRRTAIEGRSWSLDATVSQEVLRVGKKLS